MPDMIYNTKHAQRLRGLLSSSFDSEEVMELYEESMEAIGEVADRYGEDFKYEGLSFGHTHRSGSEELATADSVEDARALELQGMGLLGNSDNLFEPDAAYFSGESFDGEFVYRPAHTYRGARIAGRVTVRLDPGDSSEQMESDLEQAVDNVLEDEGWNLPFLGD